MQHQQKVHNGTVVPRAALIIPNKFGSDQKSLLPLIALASPVDVSQAQLFLLPPVSLLLAAISSGNLGSSYVALVLVHATATSDSN